MNAPGLRHMSQSDAFTWYMERDPLLRSTVVVVMVFDQPPDPARVLARLDRASRIVPGLRHRLVEPPWRVATPLWTVDPDFDLSWHVRRVAAAPPAALAGALDLARTEGMGGFDRARPLWTWTTVEGLEDGRAAGVMKIHHSLTDGIGGVQLVSELMDFAADAPEPTATATAPVAHVLGAIGVLCDAIAFQAERLGRVTRETVGQAPRRVARVLRDPRAVAGNLWRTSGSIFRTVRPITDTRSPIMTERRLGWHYAVLDVPLDELKRAGSAAGGSLNDAFLASIAGGLERYHESHGARADSLRVAMPISVRAPGDPPGGNRVTLTRFDVPTAPCTAVERMRAVHARVDSARLEPAIPLTNTIAGVLNLLPTGVVGAMLKHVDFLASNVPGLDVPVYLGGARVLQIYPFGPTLGAALNVTLLSYCSTCNLGVNCDTGAVPDPDLLLECLREGFDEVLATGAPEAGAEPEVDAGHRVAVSPTY
jgi:diacylglycerol O-acyltransferase